MLARNVLFISVVMLSQLIFANELRYLHREYSEDNKDMITMAEVEKTSPILFFFTLDCPVCARQVSEFQCIKDKNKLAAITFEQKVEKVRRYTRKIKLAKSGFKNIFIVDRKYIKKLKKQPRAFPQTVIVKDNQVVFKKLGFVECSEIAPFI